MEISRCPCRKRPKTSVIFTACERTGILFVADTDINRPNFPSRHSLMNIFSSIPLRWWVVSSISALGVTAICLRVLETDGTRAKRAERNKNKELRSLAERISSYGNTVHKQYPTGEVVVSERDLAEQLRKRPDAVATALNLLLSEQKVQRAPLRGYWRLNL